MSGLREGLAAQPEGTRGAQTASSCPGAVLRELVGDSVPLPGNPSERDPPPIPGHLRFDLLLELDQVLGPRTRCPREVAEDDRRVHPHVSRRRARVGRGPQRVPNRRVLGTLFVASPSASEPSRCTPPTTTYPAPAGPPFGMAAPSHQRAHAGRRRQTPARARSGRRACRASQARHKP
jgi:hypothetical protein